MSRALQEIFLITPQRHLTITRSKSTHSLKSFSEHCPISMVTLTFYHKFFDVKNIWKCYRILSALSSGHCLLISKLETTGGIEDTRLEAKAKDTKKIRGQDQGQGQPMRGQTLSRPRTGMLEAKAKDQGHKRKCSPKKKRSSQKFFKRFTKF